MTRIKFAIIQAISGSTESLVIERNQDQLVDDLTRRVGEQLGGWGDDAPRFTRQQVQQAIATAFAQVAEDFKRQTVRLLTVPQKVED